jgi:UDPglucose--hexose-1-phosphate uridylyltransferase
MIPVINSLNMPELRKDPIIGRWVIIAGERGKRPTDFKREAIERINGGDVKECPFCEGNEDKTPPEHFAYRTKGSQPNTPGWHLRVVSNKFPALKVEGELTKKKSGIYDTVSGVGAHEVIIESPNHEDTLASMSHEQFEAVIRSYSDRMVALKKDLRLKYILIFKNHGYRAGASLEHTHTQLIALPIIPKAVKEELDGSKKYFKRVDHCLYCDMVGQELSEKTRVVAENDDYLSICPFAPRFPFEMWVLPKRHAAHFEDITKREIGNLTGVLQESLAKLSNLLHDPPYNFMLHTSPVATGNLEHYHWHIEITPRITRVAGFERGSGFYINPMAPEDSAKYLREVK